MTPQPTLPVEVRVLVLEYKQRAQATPKLPFPSSKFNHSSALSRLLVQSGSCNCLDYSFHQEKQTNLINDIFNNKNKYKKGKENSGSEKGEDTNSP